MTAPMKPWERAGVNFQNGGDGSFGLPVNSMSGTLGQDSISSSLRGVTSASPLSSTSTPPQVPLRPTQQMSLASRINPGSGYGGNGGYSGYSSPFGSGGYGGSMYSSPYSSHGGGYAYNRYNDMNSSFARHAEESSRPAFESIESIVNAVNSVGMMLDSTFQAVYNSFRAVIGVADNFTRLKSQLVQVFSALAFIRTLRYFVRRVLELLRLRPQGEAARQWSEAFKEAASIVPEGSGSKRSSWPILLFFGIIMGGPYLVWKFISAFSGTSGDEQGWAKCVDDHFVAKANYSFQGQSDEELSFSAGQNITVAPKELQPRVRGWLLGSVDGQTVGMIPANYVTVMGKRQGSKSLASLTQPLRQTDSGISMAQEYGVASSQQSLPSLPSQDMESAFPNLPSSSSFSHPESIIEKSTDQLGQNSDPQQEAADILNDVGSHR